MELVIEWYLAVTLVIIGLSHLLRPADWAEAYRQWHACGHPGVFVNGGLHLVTGAAIVGCHRSWEWPGAMLTAFGWLLVAKGFLCLIWPQKAMQSMAAGSRSLRGFVVAGVMSITIGLWACYCVWNRTHATQLNRAADDDR